MKKIILIFLLGFLFNIIWENLHSFLYVNYKGENITQIILLRAALFDALFISIIGFLFTSITFLKNNIWLVIPIGFVFAIILEIFALGTGRWAYKEIMPMVPVLYVGLTPTIQLGLTSYLTIKLVESKINH